MIRAVLITSIKAYRLLLSAWLGSACRFTPTCSAYAIAALEGHGSSKGSYLTLKRLARCHPWCNGGYDPVPSVFSFFKQKEDHTSSPTIVDTP
jgi:putative membrane protein insertion efficiency factor